MKQVLVLGLAFVLCLILTVSASAEQKLKVRLVTGDVVSIDPTSRNLMVKSKIYDVLITANEATSIRENRVKKSFADIVLGSKVTVKYVVKDGQNIAKIIDIKGLAEKN